MRAIVQRVTEASVKIDQNIRAAISNGLLIYVGIEDADNLEDCIWISNKICGLRIFNDQSGQMNCSIKEIAGEILLISQFTLHASTKKGNRPSFLKASKSEFARPLYEQLIIQFEKVLLKKISAGVFGADMKVTSINDGPVTIIIDTKNKE